MKSLPRIRLRTIFLLFICAAVGLAIGLAPIQKIDPSFGLGWHEPRINLVYSLLAVASVAIVVGLLNEIAVVWQWAPPAGNASDGMRFARAFAIAWRSAIAGLLSLWATAGIEHAQPAEFQMIGAFPDQRAERFELFWLTMAAQSAVVVAGANLLLANKYGASCGWRALLAIGGYTTSLSIVAAFCVWYYGTELHRVSPYLAEAKVGSNLLEWSRERGNAPVQCQAGSVQPQLPLR